METKNGRQIKRWTAELDRAVKELRALGVEPTIAPPPWMQEVEAYRHMTRARFDRETAGGSSLHTKEESEEQHRIMRILIDLVGVHKAMEIMQSVSDAEIERHLIEKYGGGSK